MSAPSTPDDNDTPALPTQPVTACSGPWLHEKFRTLSLDINATARMLADRIAAVTMATAMAQYHRDTDSRYTSEMHEGFTTDQFTKQLRTMVVAFESHAARYNAKYDAQTIKKTRFPEVKFDNTQLDEDCVSGRMFDQMMLQTIPRFQPWTTTFAL
ncbi:hypothetical protein GGX14DRAFT_568306 [Mycena pura]|uniref:Uncharacterized protein n=1 Tax=Mycena pura TaxID=153505 RepID=A0AAD6VCX6_9AGAR|nr:hypothetical protein GGX14DRAFT_568306 [Mycena pura]